MKEIGIGELRELQMQILDYVDAFCRKHDIKYTISGGTLLGAVRHGGYIPWDDDIDIQMLRMEYNRFTDLWNREGNHGYYELVNIESGNSMGYPFGKVHDTRTVTYAGGVVRTGVFIDVFQVDNVLDKQDFIARHRAIRKLHTRQFLRFSLSRNDVPLIRKLRALFLFPIKSRKRLAVEINNLAMLNNRKEAPFVYEMIAGAKCKNPIPREVFDEYTDIRFENRTYMCVADKHTYLSQTFGDYMKLPPLEKQVRVHDFIPFWK